MDQRAGRQPQYELFADESAEHHERLNREPRFLAFRLRPAEPSRW